MIDSELDIICNLTNVSREDIKLANDGFLSRGYVVDNGRIVFKFKKNPATTYRNEIKMLNFLNGFDLGIKMQKVGWTSEEDEYLGLYGVVGVSIEATHYDVDIVGECLGAFLRKIHKLELGDAEIITLKAEIEAWQQRFLSDNSLSALQQFFSGSEMEGLKHFMNHTVPDTLTALGEKIVFSHGDLGDGNILVDDDGTVGVIDFNECCCLDEAADFMDVEDDRLCDKMLKAYGADKSLVDKVKIRRTLRPLIVFGNYAERHDLKKLEKLVRQIRLQILNPGGQNGRNS